tara:strand:- start:2897 stop:3073 length:177 start_codon:yes stop_codon:yes gene_type:complete
MTTQQKVNLFSGPTEAQLNHIQNKQNAETTYIEFVRKNPSLSMSAYESKYKDIMNSIK